MKRFEARMDIYLMHLIHNDFPRGEKSQREFESIYIEKLQNKIVSTCYGTKKFI